jgi:hypothetical protein
LYFNNVEIQDLTPKQRATAPSVCQNTGSSTK